MLLWKVLDFSFNKISERQGNHKCTRHFRSWKLTFTLIGNSNKENTKFKIFHFPPFSQHPNRKCRSRHKIRVEKEKTNGIVMQPEKKNRNFTKNTEGTRAYKEDGRNFPMKKMRASVWRSPWWSDGEREKSTLFDFAMARRQREKRKEGKLNAIRV